MKVSNQTIILLSSITLAGCDFYAGISRISDQFQPYPGTSCIVEAASSIDGVSDVSYTEEEGLRPTTLTGIQRPNAIHRFWYKYNGIENNFSFTVRYDGKTEFRHDYGCLNCIPPQEKIEAVYPYMLAVEHAIESQCGVQDLVNKIQEYCGRVECPNGNGT